MEKKWEWNIRLVFEDGKEYTEKHQNRLASLNAFTGCGSLPKNKAAWISMFLIFAFEPWLRPSNPSSPGVVSKKKRVRWVEWRKVIDGQLEVQVLVGAHVPWRAEDLCAQRATPRHLTHISGDVKFTTASFFLSERKIFQGVKYYLLMTYDSLDYCNLFNGPVPHWFLWTCWNCMSQENWLSFLHGRFMALSPKNYFKIVIIGFIMSVSVYLSSVFFFFFWYSFHWWFSRFRLIIFFCVFSLIKI